MAETERYIRGQFSVLVVCVDNGHRLIQVRFGHKLLLVIIDFFTRHLKSFLSFTAFTSAWSHFCRSPVTVDQPMIGEHSSLHPRTQIKLQSRPALLWARKPYVAHSLFQMIIANINSSPNIHCGCRLNNMQIIRTNNASRSKKLYTRRQLLHRPPGHVNDTDSGLQFFWRRPTHHPSGCNRLRSACISVAC